MRERYLEMTPSFVMSFTVYEVENLALKALTACVCVIFPNIAFDSGAIVLEAAAATDANDGAAGPKEDDATVPAAGDGQEALVVGEGFVAFFRG